MRTWIVPTLISALALHSPTRNGTIAYRTHEPVAKTIPMANMIIKVTNTTERIILSRERNRE